ncbi:MAG TPA: pectin acetylesterase-family hydrolase [Candidatus Binatia bacterium]
MRRERRATGTITALLAGALLAFAGCSDSDTANLPPDTEFRMISPVGPIEYEGRELFPMCMDGSPYHFWAKRGSVNKLLVYYQGGGACWNQLTCSLPACDTNVDPNGGDNPNFHGSGFANLNDPRNPFRDWHILYVPYCSCDIHFGDAAQDYPLHVEHRGYHNARVAEKYARENFPNPEEVFVTGTSAGAYGAFFQAPLLHLAYPNARFYVLADAGNGVITQEFLDEYFPNWNFIANLPPEIPQLREVLENDEGMPGYTRVVAHYFPESRWAHYTTAFDGGFGGQTGFYNIMLNGNDPVAALTWWEGSCAFNERMRAQAIQQASESPSNYRYYIGTGSRHGMWGLDKVYEDTTGGVPTIVDWVNAMLAGSPAWTNVECTNCGLTLPGDPRPDPLQPPFVQVGDDVVIDCD